jgi:hypothetical protein
MIPIGAYAPRHLMSTNHNAPIDAVRMFKDVVSLRPCTWGQTFQADCLLPVASEECYRYALGHVEDGA